MNKKLRIRRLCVAWMFLATLCFGQDPNFHIYLCFGQSNMEGQGTIETQDQSVDSRFQIMQAVACSGQPAGKWRTATPPLARCNTKLGPADYFGREMIENLPSNIKVGIVFVAVSGCKIELFDKVNYATYAAGEQQWMKDIIAQYGGNPYGKLVELAKLAQKDGVIKGILLHQGESNSGESTWPNKVKGVYQNLLTDLGLTASNVPLLAGQVVDAAQGGLCAGHNSVINSLPNTIPTSYVISSSGCTDQSDNLHFTSAGYRLLGERYAQKMLTLLPVECTAAPTVTSPVTYEQGATASPLTATGTALKWYTVATGGTASTTAPTPSTSTVGSTTYYVSQTLNNCEGTRASIVVNVVNNYKINKVNAAPIIDGTIDDIWTHANVMSASATKLLSGTVSNTADLSGNFKALWDNTYLYVLANITDDTKVNDSQNSYDDDAVEVYIDINNDKATAYGANDVQYTFGWNDGTVVGALPSGRSTTGITYAAVARTGGYIVEARIPWTTVQGTPVAGQIVGIDFMINDDDDNAARDGKLSWNAATDNAWQDPSLFGTVRLMDIVTDVQDASLNNEGLVVYPNPFSENIKIEGNGEFWYQLINASGQVLNEGWAYDMVVLVQNVPKGLYMVKVSENHKNSVFKVIKE